ncbi:hypothetical protein SEUCBS139899_007624 [Sporothrix eucalyptigena]
MPSAPPAESASPRSPPTSPTALQTTSSPPTAQPVFQLGAHKSCDACKARKVKCPSELFPKFCQETKPMPTLSADADYPKPCGNCLRRKETCCFGKKKVPRRNVTKHLRFTQPLKGTEQSAPASSKTLCYVDQPLAPSREKKTSQRETTLPSRPSPSSDAAVPSSTKASTSAPIIPTLYLDHVLSQAQANCHKKAGDKGSQDASPADGELPSGKVNSIFGGSYRLTYFTESRLISLSSRLRNHKVDDLVRRINAHIRQRLRKPAEAPDAPDTSTINSSDAVHVEPEFAVACIQAYFERAHPLCPFLDRAAFEARALPGSDASGTTKEPVPKKAWSALYYSVLAIGCAYLDSSSASTANTRRNSVQGFEPGKSTAWRLFAQGALAHFHDLHLLPEDSLLTLQALTAMSIYGLGVACLSFERVILTEAARRAQSMAQSPNALSSVSFQRTFWLLYGIEKVTSFHFGRSSTFVDSDIACPFPESFGDGPLATDTWPILWIRHARLLSRTYASLFSVGMACNSTAVSLATIDQLHAEVEAWRLSVPETRGLRPDTSSTAPGLRSLDPAERTMTLGHRYMYHSIVLILSHVQLHHLSQLPAAQKAEPATVAAQKVAQDTLMVAARAILELTPLIEVESHTPLWLLAVVPLMALLVLFDMVVHSPQAPSSSTGTGSGNDTALNLVLLDMGAGYFSRIEYASGGSLPGSLLSEFAHIARDYVNDYQRRQRERERERPDRSVDIVPSSTTSIPTLQIQQPLPSPPAPTLSESVLLSQAADMPSQPFSAMGSTSTMWSLPPTVPSVVADISNTTTSKESQIQPTSLDLLSTSDLPTFNNSLVFPDGNSGPSSRDGSVYGANPGYWNGSNGADLTGTDVMGLFTSNYYFLPEMDGILYGNYNGM